MEKFRYVHLEVNQDLEVSPHFVPPILAEYIETKEEAQSYLKNEAGFIAFAEREPGKRCVNFYYPEVRKKQLLDLLKNPKELEKLSDKEQEKYLVEFLYYWIDLIFKKSYNNETFNKIGITPQPIYSKEAQEVMKILLEIEKNPVFSKILLKRKQEIESKYKQNLKQYEILPSSYPYNSLFRMKVFLVWTFQAEAHKEVQGKRDWQLTFNEMYEGHKKSMLAILNDPNASERRKKLAAISCL